MTVQLVKKRGRVSRVIERARRPDKNHVEALKQRVPFWFTFLILFAFATWQIMMNPFGFSDLVQRYTQDVSNLLITGPYLYPATGRDKISVVIVDDKTLHTLATPWPWTYGTQARMLDSLLAYHPRAVIVDFLFYDPRADDSLPELVDEIHRFQKARVPIYFEGGINLPYGEDPLRKELAATGIPILDPSIAVYNGIARQYPTTGQCFGPKHKPGDTCLSLALQVYKDLYPATPPEPLADKMELVWGTRYSPHNKWITYTDDNGETFRCEDKRSGLTRIYLAFFDTNSVKGHCPYQGMVPAESVMMGGDDKDITDMLSNKIVFYGGDIEGAQDKSATPVNALQPNVFIHAMALDNLITFGGKPEQDVMTVGRWTFSSNPAQILAITPVILILSWIHRARVRRKRKREAAPSSHGRSAAFEYFLDKIFENVWHYFAFALALGIGLLLALAVGLSVANWVEVVFVSVELAAMLLLGVPDSVWGYLHHVAGGVPDFATGEQEP
jgi:hypothetical protein